MEIPRFWRLKDVRYKLLGTKCTKGHLMVGKRPVCVECGNKTNQHPIQDKSTLLLPPNNQVVHSEVVRKNQE